MLAKDRTSRGFYVTVGVRLWGGLQDLGSNLQLEVLGGPGGECLEDVT